jgi:SAM-dependent methyltransferase
VSKERPELAGTPLPLEVHLPVLSCRGGPEMAERFFTPLGWQVEARPLPLDETVPAWGPSRYVDLRLTGRQRVADAVNHLYVGLPVLDDATHYWVSADEVDKLLRAGSGWLATHPDRDLVTRRYLAHSRPLARQAMARLAEVDDADPDAFDDATEPAVPAATGAADVDPDAAADRPVPLAAQRHGAVLAALQAAGARRVVDLGCGSGALLPVLLAEPSLTEIVAVDVSHRALEDAARRLRLDRMPERQRARLTLLQSALTYTDKRLVGYDAAVLVEVVEHLDPDRLTALEHAVLGHARPTTVIMTTPNAEHNVRYPALAAERSAIATTGSSGRAPSSQPGRHGWPTGTATPYACCPSAPTTPRSAPRRRWPCSPAPPARAGPGVPHERDRSPRPVPRRAHRRVRVGQEHVRADALPPHAGAVERRVPWAGRRRRERPERHTHRVRRPPPHRRGTAAGRTADGRRRDEPQAGGPRRARPTGP